MAILAVVHLDNKKLNEGLRAATEQLVLVRETNKKQDIYAKRIASLDLQKTKYAADSVVLAALGAAQAELKSRYARE